MWVGWRVGQCNTSLTLSGAFQWLYCLASMPTWRMHRSMWAVMVILFKMYKSIFICKGSINEPIGWIRPRSDHWFIYHQLFPCGPRWSEMFYFIAEPVWFISNRDWCVFLFSLGCLVWFRSFQSNTGFSQTTKPTLQKSGSLVWFQWFVQWPNLLLSHMKQTAQVQKTNQKVSVRSAVLACALLCKTATSA